MSKYDNQNHSTIVYSTEHGKISKKPEQRLYAGSADGVLRFRYETKGRGGKGVTVVEGMAGDIKQLKDLAKQLKQHCGTGGAVKEGNIEIQGDQRVKLKLFLQQKGFTCKG